MSGCTGAVPVGSGVLLELCPICNGHLFVARHPSRGLVEICESGKHIWEPSLTHGGQVVRAAWTQVNDPKKAAANDRDE